MFYGCPRSGKEELKTTLRSIPITSEKQACLLLNTSEMYELDGEFQNEIKKTLASQMHAKNQYCGALRWYMDANELSTASTVSDALLVCLSFLP